MPCAVRSRSSWRRLWTSTACWSLGPCPGPRSPSPAPMRRAQSSLCLRDETLAGGQRRKLSSRFPVGRSSESFSPGDTPRQRFRQRRPGPLGAPISQGKGPSVGWGSSVETLPEHGPEVQEPEKRPLAPSLSQ
uniref:Coiled-coil domain containing 88B n=1 Tax=Cebus imitator TaxID=2715852 RepID=A0A2K5PNJ4_CEBIM